MYYQIPTIQYQGLLSEILQQFIPAGPQLHRHRDMRIDKLIHFIDSHAGSVVTCGLDSVCRELKLDISAAYAGRLFKRMTGLGVREYAGNRRLLTAADRLQRTDLPIKVIALEVGYCTPPHFTRRFKEAFHLSPTEFRKKRLSTTNIAVRRMS